MTIKEALEIERKRLLEDAEMIAAMPPVDAEKWGLKSVWVKPDGDGWDLTEHVICPVCGERTLYERGHFPPSKMLCEHQTAQNETEQLRAQLETARKALERIALGQTMSASIAARALAQISAEQEGGE